MSEVGANQTEYDNGGAIAIKGFNFQHAIAALIIIGNYEKEKFSIYLETKDDIEVVYDRLSDIAKTGNVGEVYNHLGVRE